MTKPEIFIGADHLGFPLKEQLKPWLEEQGYQVTDCGNTQLDPDDDYPQFSFAVAEAVAQANGQAQGIIICGSGVGVTIAANRVAGIRASTAVSPAEVHHARQHDDLNVLAISADYTDQETVKAMISTFLATPFSGDERHVRRIHQISQYEQSH